GGGGGGGGISDANWSANFHVDLFRLGFLSLGQRDGQNAIFILRRNFVGSDRCRQRDAPLEAANKPFGSINLGVLKLVFAFPFAGNTQRAVMQRDLNLVLLHARQFRFDDDVVFVLENVQSWS